MCVGDTLCASDEIKRSDYCLTEEKKSGECSSDDQCKGERRCVNKYCRGNSGCGEDEKKCLVNEEYNVLGPGRCQGDQECRGK